MCELMVYFSVVAGAPPTLAVRVGAWSFIYLHNCVCNNNEIVKLPLNKIKKLILLLEKIQEVVYSLGRGWHRGAYMYIMM